MREPIDIYIIDRIRELRKERGMSQLDLANAIGHESVSTIAKCESPNPKYQNTYNIHQINKIVKALKCSYYDIFPNKAL